MPHNFQIPLRKIMLYGVAKTVAQWARISGICSVTIFSRLRAGYSEKAAVFTPVEHPNAGIPVYGKWLSLNQWSKISGIKPSSIRIRLAFGWPPKIAIFQPLTMTDLGYCEKYNRIVRPLDEMGEQKDPLRRHIVMRNAQSVDRHDIIYHGSYTE